MSLPLSMLRGIARSAPLLLQSAKTVRAKTVFSATHTHTAIRRFSSGAFVQSSNDATATATATPTPTAAPKQTTSLLQYSRTMFQLVNENKYSQVLDIYQEILRAGLKPDITVYNYLVTAHLKLQNVNEAFSFLREMKAYGFQPPQRFLPIFWKIFLQTKDNDRALAALDIMIDIDMVPDAPKLSEAVIMLSQSKDPEALNKMLRYLNSARQFGIVLIKDAHEAVMLRCVRDGNINQAFSIMQKYDREGRSFYLSNPILEKLLQFAAQYDHNEAAAYILNKLKSNSVELEESTLNQILYSSARLANLSLAQETWQAFEAQKTPPSSAAYHSMLHTTFAAQNIAEGFRFLVNAKSQNIPIPSAIQKMIGSKLAFSIVTLDNSFYAIEDLQSQGLEIPIEAINSIIYGCSQVGELDRAFATFAEISRFNLKPDLDSYNAILSGCQMRNRYVTAIRVIEDMKNAQIEPDAESYNYLIVLSAIQNQMQRVESLLTMMGEKNMRVAPQSYRTIARKYARRGEIENATGVLEQMRKAGYFVSNSLAEYVRSGGFRDILVQKVAEAKQSIASASDSGSTASSPSSSSSSSGSDLDDFSSEEEDNATVAEKAY
eukprot:TRINITY_DN2780_c0_g2_i1.p1 TRINITY_DN2780_c0_g2~~TRINITY_DN2780_c0_g2_i1.p1  ORF type:complete len:605 (-),score=164.45 TRINITY_DN2780_c0_g2_i1:300-2114(-)